MEPLQAAQQTFFAESRELLCAMEDALLHLEKTHDAPDALNAVFRAAHTIKLKFLSFRSHCRSPKCPSLLWNIAARRPFFFLCFVVTK